MSKKVDKCKMCQTMRCCPEHCCNWDDCQCKDCVLCGGTLGVDYTHDELEEMKKIKEQEEMAKRKAEEEKERQAKQAILDQKEKERLEREEEFNQKVREAMEKEQKEEEEYKKKIKENNKRYQETLDMITQSQKDTEATLAKLNRTMETLNNTIQGVRETNTKYENFKNEFDNMMRGMVEHLGKVLVPPHKRSGNDEISMPEISDISSVSEMVLSKSDIVVLTGAGISAASGIPTFRGEGGMWTLRDKKEIIKAQEFRTYKYFKEHPEEVWRWHHQLKKTVYGSSPNINHRALADIQMFCTQAGINFTLITQNVDNFHVDAYYEASGHIKTKNEEETKEARNNDPDDKQYGFCNEVLEIHGNINYMRCDKDCTIKLFPSPMIGCPEDLVPTCPYCKGPARPHTLFFDEAYNEEYYRRDTVLNRIALMDCLIVIGTALETNLACRIVNQAEENNALIVEINPEPCIEAGQVKQLIGKAEDILPEFCKQIKSKLSSHFNK